MRRSAATLVSAACVAGCVAFVVWQLHPMSLLFQNTTTAGGDTGAHVLVPWYLNKYLLPNFQLTGWSPDWFDGFPILTFYFPLPSLLTVGLGHLIAANVAFKLVSVLGSLLLPIVVFALGRLTRLPRPGPEILAVASVGYLFDRSFTIDGGNLASTMAGEYDFSLSLALAVLFLGVTAAGLRQGRYHALAAALLAGTALCHIIPPTFAGVGALALVVIGPGRRRIRWAVPVGVVAGLVTLWWSLPFVWRLPYSTSMGWTKVTVYVDSLLPEEIRWAFALAVVGAMLSFARGRTAGKLLAVLAVWSALMFIYFPDGAIYNARFLPFWILCLYLLAGIGIAEMVIFAEEEWRRSLARSSARRLAEQLSLMPPELAAAVGAAPQRRGPGLFSTVGAPLVVTAVGLIAVLSPLGLPSWSPIHTVQTSFVPSWIDWNYTGYQGKSTWPEYDALITTMGQIGDRYGCGPAMWEYGPELNDLGTPMALMLLPMWTNDCIDSMEGLLFESAATTPYHFINQAELSENPSEAMGGLPYGSLDVALGVQHLQMLGVRYYMAFTPQAIAQANGDPALKPLTTSGPWPTVVGSQVIQRTWHIYLVQDSAPVVSLSNQPVVLTGVPKSSSGWLDAMLPWYDDSTKWNVLEAASGPSSWQRVSSTAVTLPATPVPSAGVSDIRVSAEQISFRVARTGTPVLVKTSYFPNWQVSGASGVYRVAPNLMVVVPTSHTVTLHYGVTPVDLLGWAGTALGLAGLVWLGLLDRRRRGERHPGESEDLLSADMIAPTFAYVPVHEAEPAARPLVPAGRPGASPDQLEAGMPAAAPPVLTVRWPSAAPGGGQSSAPGPQVGVSPPAGNGLADAQSNGPPGKGNALVDAPADGPPGHANGLADGETDGANSAPVGEEGARPDEEDGPSGSRREGHGPASDVDGAVADNGGS